MIEIEIFEEKARAYFYRWRGTLTRPTHPPPRRARRERCKFYPLGFHLWNDYLIAVSNASNATDDMPSDRHSLGLLRRAPFDREGFLKPHGPPVPRVYRERGSLSWPNDDKHHDPASRIIDRLRTRPSTRQRTRPLTRPGFETRPEH